MTMLTPSKLQRLGCALALVAAAGGTPAATWDWQASSGLRPSDAGAIARLATGSASDPLLPGGPLRLHSGAEDEWMFYMSIGQQLAMPEQLELSFTARLVDLHSSSPLRSALTVVANLEGGRGATLVIGSGAVSFLRWDDLAFNSTVALDTSVHHDYRLAISGPQNGAPMKLYVDGVQRLSDHVSQGSLYTPHARIWFGDASYVASGTSEWLSFSHNAAAVPEPAAMALLLAGLGLVGGIARRRGGAAS